MKKVLTLILALITVLRFSACGWDAAAQVKAVQSESPAAEGVSDGEKVTLTWALWDLEATAYWQALADGYMAANPEITLEIIDLGSADYTTQLAAYLASGNSELDIVSIKDIPGYSNLINLGMLEPMNANLTIDPAAFKGILDQLKTEEGNFYAVPFRFDMWVLYYNKDLFKAAGIAYPSNNMTLAEYDTLARQMTSGTGPDKVYGTHYHTWRSTASLFGILDGKQTIVASSYDFLKPIYEMVVAQQKDGICMEYGDLKIAGLHYSAAFENGLCAMLPMGSWFIATLQTYNTNAMNEGMDPVNFGIVKYPHPEGTSAGTTLGAVTSLGVNINSEQKAAAIDFVNWCAGPEGAAIVASTGSFPAAATDDSIAIISSTEGFPDDEASMEALKTESVYLEMPLSTVAFEIETVLSTEHDTIMTGTETIDEGIANMNKQVGEILAE